MSSICTSPKASFISALTLRAWVMAMMGGAMSAKGSDRTKAWRMWCSSSSSDQPSAGPAPMTAPMEAPPMKSMGVPASRRAFSAPMWA
ncbi:hypothetical protein D3C73_977850 [compost metagenome]